MVVLLPGGERVRGIHKFGGVTDVRRRRERNQTGAQAAGVVGWFSPPSPLTTKVNNAVAARKAARERLACPKDDERVISDAF